METSRAKWVSWGSASLLAFFLVIGVRLFASASPHESPGVVRSLLSESGEQEFVPLASRIGESCFDALVREQLAEGLPPAATERPSAQGLISPSPDDRAEWAGVQRSSRNLGALFALAPNRVAANSLVRHARLNPSDKCISREDMDSLAALISWHSKRFLAAEHARSKIQSDCLSELFALGRLGRFDLASLDPAGQERVRSSASLAVARDKSQGIATSLASAMMDALMNEARSHVPNAAAFRRTADGIFYATRDQLPHAEPQTKYLSFLIHEFFFQVVAWFEGRGLTSSAILEEDARELERLSLRR